MGLKYVGLDERLRLNAAAFYSDYTDLQVTVIESIAPVVKNGGSATIQGLEIEGAWAATDSMIFEWAIGWLDSSYDNVDPATGLTGNESLTWAPEWTFSANVSNAFYLSGDGGTLTPRVDWYYRDKTWFDAFNTLDAFQEGYGIINASVAWENRDGRFGAVLGVNNIADEDFLHARLPHPDLGFFQDVQDRGREWYLTLKVQY